MRQRTFLFHDSYDAVRFLDSVRASEDYGNAVSVLVDVFTTRDDADFIGYLSDIVRKKLDKAQIAGLTCQAGFAHGDKLDRTTVFTILFFFSSEIKILEYDFAKTPSDEVKSDFLSAVRSLGDLKGIQVYTTPMKNSCTNDVLSAVALEAEGVPVFGAGAGYAVKSKKRELYVFGREIHKNGLVAVLFSGKNLGIYAESTLGWTPIGKVMEATDVFGDHILRTVDGEVAGDVFKRYLGVVSGDNFIENTCEFPFMIRRGGKWIARVPMSKDEDGFVHFAADINKGEKLVFSYGAKKIILQQSFNLAEYMSRKNLECLLLHVCRNMYEYLKEEEFLELEAFFNFYRETAGCFAFSEILYKGGSGGVQNSALVAVGMEECEDGGNASSSDCFIEDGRHENNMLIDFDRDEAGFPLGKRDRRILPFEERLVNFLHATSRDLSLANAKLEEAAMTDGLTKLFNRKKIAECIESELRKNVSAENVCLIMFDIDNFKRINDTYGHDMGDEVLVKIAKTAKNCVRSGDSIGRWGGEEFMILVVDAKKDEAVSIAERIRTEINSIRWPAMPAVSVSLGVAGLRVGDDSQTLYKRVDNRLYYAKTHGKNRVAYEDYE
ncbi:MAG: GGDEF domain-containing protein [Treponema sp.]|nr:GGDEF domain-containing protein [Treponema sp.]